MNLLAAKRKSMPVISWAVAWCSLQWWDICFFIMNSFFILA